VDRREQPLAHGGLRLVGRELDGEETRVRRREGVLPRVAPRDLREGGREGFVVGVCGSIRYMRSERGREGGFCGLCALVGVCGLIRCTGG
jgi:hypothetical protein